MRADEVFGPTFIHIDAWYCTVHHGIAEDDDDVCDRMPLLPWKRTPCHLWNLGYHAHSDGGPVTHDELSDMLVEAAAERCCNNAEWRGHLCTFHGGYQQGVDAALEAYAKLLGTTQFDGKVCD